MADPRMAGLLKHFRDMADVDQKWLDRYPAAADALRDRVAARRALWQQLADEVQAYLDGDLQHTDDPTQLTLGAPPST